MLPNIKDPSGFKFSIFDPLIAPGNVAIYDGDVNLSAANWRDNAGGNQITFFNAPTYNAAGLNGHGTILFDGINQYGNSTTPVINTPYTLYLVMKQITWTNADFIFSDGTTAPNLQLIQLIASPNIRTGNTGGILQTTDLIIDTYGIVTVVMNGDKSMLRVDLNNPIIAIGDSDPRNGITLAANTLLSVFGNIEVAFMIMRNVADPIYVQNNFINYFKNYFSI